MIIHIKDSYRIKSFIDLWGSFEGDSVVGWFLWRRLVCRRWGEKNTWLKSYWMLFTLSSPWNLSFVYDINKLRKSMLYCIWYSFGIWWTRMNWKRGCWKNTILIGVIWTLFRWLLQWSWGGLFIAIRCIVLFILSISFQEELKRIRWIEWRIMKTKTRIS